jgi:selenophosphate synthase
MGGFASGLSLVGELGPELVDFNAPGRVYTAEQTRGMFMPMSSTTQTFNLMVSELQDLREEVTQLRKEQQRQTGDMIMTNYDAQQKVAEEIVEAVMTSVREKSWQDKSKPTIS